MIATFGLFQNSPAVIIGAMIIAPLMRPLAGLSLATLTADSKLLTNALVTLSCGTLIAGGLAYVLALCLHSLEVTAEMMNRMHPTVLDLGVAMVAGAVGAYCQTRESLANSLAGVSIAVALVPPLSVVGIGLAFGNTDLAAGASLLYLTNLVGIASAGSIVFLLEGYTPLNQAKRGLAISLILNAFLLVPLALSMRELLLENQISATVKTLLQDKTATFKGMQVREVRVLKYKKPMQVQVTALQSTLQANEPINDNQVKMVQDFLSREVAHPLELKLRIIPFTEFTGADKTAGEAIIPQLIPADGSATSEN